MAEIKTAVIADNIISPLGFTSGENYRSVKAYRSELCRYEGKWELPEPFCASLINRDAVIEQCDKEGIRGRYTFFEKMAILSIKKALDSCGLDAASDDTIFILSTTKGNVDMLRSNYEDIPAERELPGETAKVIADFFGNINRPVVTSNACISGITAQITAKRIIERGQFKNVVVCGAEVQSPFIISGFQSLKALSDIPCRPFDEDRLGINLGDAAATVILSGKQEKELGSEWIVDKVSAHNDGYHISTPSRNAEGAFRCLQQVLEGEELGDIAFVNAHGTGTLYNDEMEAVALYRAGLQNMPVNSLKGYFGHTMGAAGVLESIVSMYAANDGCVLGTRGFNESGVSRKMNISNEHRECAKHSFVKLISGFGGCNAAVLYKKRI